jgi:ABC-type phosphate transport system permease subunit
VQQSQQPDALIVTVIKEPVQETTVADVLIGSFGLAGFLLLVALALGVLAGLALVVWHRFRPTEWRPMPPVTPSLSQTDGPPSSQAR